MRKSLIIILIVLILIAFGIYAYFSDEINLAPLTLKRAALIPYNLEVLIAPQQGSYLVGQPVLLAPASTQQGQASSGQTPSGPAAFSPPLTNEEPSTPADNCPAGHTDNGDGTCTANITANYTGGYVYETHQNWSDVRNADTGTVNSASEKFAKIDTRV